MSMCLCKKFKLLKLYKFLVKNKDSLSLKISFISVYANDFLHVQLLSEESNSGNGGNGKDMDVSDVFVLEYGCVVTWNVDKATRKILLNMVKDFQVGTFERTESDDFEYFYDNQPSIEIHNDIIKLYFDGSNRQIISTPNKTIDQSLDTNLSNFNLQYEITDPILLQKLAITFGLAQSIKLNKFELLLETEFTSNQTIIQNMTTHGSIKNLKSHEISKLIGKLFMLRFDLNLNSNVLDFSPEYLWDDVDDKYLVIYKKIYKYLEIKKRSHILNDRLSLIHELYEMVQKEEQSGHGSKLEWLFMVLFVTQVVVEIVSLFVRVYVNM